MIKGIMKHMMKNFIIFNSEKEGSCALVQTLDNFDEITIISDFIEPFDRHMFINSAHGTGKDISKEDFLQCLSLIYGPSGDYLEQLNSVYARYNTRYRFAFSKENCRGFKMRIRKRWKSYVPNWLKK